jgi:hypothetical protein
LKFSGSRGRAGRLAAWTVALALVGAPSASAQLLYGGHLAHATDAFGGTTGVGARVGLGLPALPIQLLAGVEYYFPGCSGACGFQGLSVDGNVSLPFPFLAPYATGGWVLRRYDPPDEVEAETFSGVHLGVGIGAGIAGARVFGEARYEFVEAPERQLVLRAGFIIGG